CGATAIGGGAAGGAGGGACTHANSKPDNSTTAGFPFILITPLVNFFPNAGLFGTVSTIEIIGNTRVRQIIIDVDQCHRALHPQNLVPFNSAGAPWVLRSDVFEKSRYLSQPDTFRNPIPFATRHHSQPATFRNPIPFATRYLSHLWPAGQHLRRYP